MHVCLYVYVQTNVYKRTLFDVMKKGRICFEVCLQWNVVMPMQKSKQNANKNIFFISNLPINCLCIPQRVISISTTCDFLVFLFCGGGGFLVKRFVSTVTHLWFLHPFTMYSFRVLCICSRKMGIGLNIMKSDSTESDDKFFIYSILNDCCQNDKWQWQVAVKIPFAHVTFLKSVVFEN